jgi:hypothetical protein
MSLFSIGCAETRVLTHYWQSLDSRKERPARVTLRPLRIASEVCGTGVEVLSTGFKV